MHGVQRRLTAVVGGAVLALTVSSAAQAAPAPHSTGSSGLSTVNSCSQNVTAGHYTCFAERRSDLGFTSRAAMQAGAQATPNGYGPASLQAAYNLPSTSAGAGQRLYVVDAYDDPNAESDLAAYRSQYGLPACTSGNGCFQKLNQDGAPGPLPAANTSWSGEISLDLDMVSAICPNCGITLVEATDSSINLLRAVKQATTLGAKFVSMSWGGPEIGTEPSSDATYLTASGVVYTASTGDGAYPYGVIYPATSPNVVAVGGTSLSISSTARGWTETVWKNSSNRGTGSGCSDTEAKPAWQSIIPPSVCSRRAVSDVSAVADPSTGVAVYQTYGGSGWAVYGGTSASTPIIASVYALAGTPGPTDQPASSLYGHTGDLNDVTSGDNGTCSPALLCTAAVGWDGPTGLGTPNGTAAFSSAASGGTSNTVTIANPGSRTGTVGTATRLQIDASDSGGAALTYTATGLPTGLSIDPSSGLISGTPATAQTYAVTVTAADSTGASASTSFTWTIGAASGGVSCSGQRLGNPGFESGVASWARTAATLDSDAKYAHAGSGYTWLDGYGSTHTDSISQSVRIPAGCVASLTYYLRIDSSEGTAKAYDKFSVTVNGTPVQSFSNVDQGGGYLKRVVSLRAYSGKSVTVKWTGTEDSSVATSFLVDDTALTLS